MKKFFCVLAFLMMTCHSVRAENATDGFYTRFDVGYSYSNQPTVKKGYAVELGFGQKWAKVLRSEFSVAYSRNRLKDLDNEARSRFPSLAAMTTTYVDLFSYKGVSAYVGAGVGIARNDMPDFVFDGNRMIGDIKYRLSWKAAAGVGIDLPKNLVLDIGYVYTDLGRFSAETVAGERFRQDVRIRKILLGLRYNF